MFTSTGNNLHVVISCEYTFLHDWMSFVTWYSICKSLPDASVEIFFYKKNINSDLFKWTKKVNLKYSFVKEEDIFSEFLFDKFVLIVNPCLVFVGELNLNNFKENCSFKGGMFVREKSDIFKENNIAIDVKTNEVGGIINYEAGWGKFHLDKWREKFCPLNFSNNMITSSMTLNETKVMKLWQKVTPLYLNLAR